MSRVEDTKLLIEFQAMMMQQVERAYQTKQMDKLTYDRFMNIRCMADTRTEILNHFEHLFQELYHYHLERLKERVRKGAQFIQSISPEDPRYGAAKRKYAELCEQLDSYDL